MLQIADDSKRFAYVSETWLLDFARIPRAYRSAVLGDVPNTLLEFTKHLKENLRSGRGLVLRGPTNSRKTSIACAICRVALNYTKKVMYVTEPDLIDALIDREMWSEDETLAYAFKTRDLLVVDDVGIESFARASSIDRLVKLIRHRANDLKATILVTNLDERQLEDRYGPALLSCLHRPCFIHLSSSLDRAPTTSRRRTPYSQRDDEVYKLIGGQDFKECTNTELLKKHRAKLRLIFKSISREAKRDILNRIRRHHKFPKSDELRKGRSTRTQ